MKTVLPAALLLFLVACTSDTASGGSVVVDSAGIRIVSNPSAVLADVQEWSIAADPDVLIGASHGDAAYEFYQIASVRSSGAGITVLLPDELRLFDSSGQFLRKLATKGEGPGELSYATGLAVVADSLVVFDESLQRLSVFHPAHGHVRSSTLPANFRRPRFLGVLFDGSILMADDLFRTPARGFEIIETALTRFTPTGAFLDSLPRQPLAEMGQLGSAEFVGMKTFGALTHVAADREGYWVARGDPQVLRYDHQGRLLRISRWEAGDRSIPDSMIATHIDALLADVPQENLAAARRELDATPVADQLPASWRVVAGPGGELWVEEFRPFTDQGPSTWIVVDDSGFVIGRTVLPARFDLHEVGADFVLGVLVDSAGIERVARYGLTRSTAR